MIQMARRIPQVDLTAAYERHRAEIDGAIARVLNRGRYILDEEVAKFEQEFATFVGSPFAIGVANGTDAITLALRACGIGPGDGVITVSHTAVATVAAIQLAGATPVFVDIDPVSYTMDPERLQAGLERWKIPLRPRALVVVHLYGQMAEMKDLSEVAAQHGLVVIEDCAQSHGARLAGRMAGTWGEAAAFSFYPTKNLGALGDGGAVVTADAKIAERVRSLRQYGWTSVRHVSNEPGVNSRLDEIQAAVLRARLGHLSRDNIRRRELAETYSSLLARSPVVLPTVRAAAEHVFHQYVVRTSGRDDLRRHLESRGVDTAVHYPVPVHLHPAYRGFHRLSDLEATEAAARSVLSLPMYPELDHSSVTRVSDSIASWSGAQAT